MTEINKTLKVLALDLEGTLITSAVSILPRPGLYDFLEYCKNKFERIVIMTAVSLVLFEKVRAVLLEYKEVPEWFVDVEYIKFQDCEESEDGIYKDLRCITNCKPEDCIIIDDMECYIREEQKNFWIEISSYKGNTDDTEFNRIIEHLDKK